MLNVLIILSQFHRIIYIYVLFHINVVVDAGALLTPYPSPMGFMDTLRGQAILPRLLRMQSFIHPHM